jgi:hypothetical protein
MAKIKDCTRLRDDVHQWMSDQSTKLDETLLLTSSRRDQYFRASAYFLSRCGK